MISRNILMTRTHNLNRMKFNFSQANAAARLFNIETIKNGQIHILSINNPEKRNALSGQMIQEMNATLDSIQKDNTMRVVILKSSTEGMFCAGADLKERLTVSNEDTENIVRGLRATFHRFYNIPVPVIACMDGPCLGGGLELALACDIRVATEQTKIGLPETGLGIIPGAGGTARLPRIVSPNIARELIYTGNILTPKQAKELNIINHVSTDFNTAYEQSIAIAEKICTKGPLAIRAAKRALNASNDLSLEDALKSEEQCYHTIVATEDRMEGLKAFVGKRKPEYQGK
jgi:methylglutaconyl-CoA hydratase